MRTYGRNANGAWVEVTTDANGNDDAIWLTTLAQALLLTPGESPFFANYGIPAQQSVVTQMFPDYYVAVMQSLFSQYFASLTITKESSTALQNPPTPTYVVNVLTHSGASLTVPIPT